MIIQFIIRGILLVAYTILAFIYKDKILKLDMIYYLPLFLYFAYICLKNLIPTKKQIFSHRFLKSHYKKKTFNIDNLNKLHDKRNKKAIIILCLWLFCLTCLGILYLFKYVNTLFIIWLVFFFHFCDLICIYIWCPFGLILGNKCCMDCRISNWDNFFRLSPLIFILNIYTTTLFILGVITLIVWEYQFTKHRERFYQTSNGNLNCTSCQNIHCRAHNKK